jgi:hypothetical protein
MVQHNCFSTWTAHTLALVYLLLDQLTIRRIS